MFADTFTGFAADVGVIPQLADAQATVEIGTPGSRMPGVNNCTTDGVVM
jgi:hypothetical protein